MHRINTDVQRHSDTIHYKILDIVRDDDLWMTKLIARDYELMDLDRLRLIFSNFRFLNNKPHGLRLTYFGDQLMCRHFKFYKFVTDYKANHKAMITLDKCMTMPYYIGRKYVCFFGEDDATWFRLNNNNLNEFVEYLE